LYPVYIIIPVYPHSGIRYTTTRSSISTRTSTYPIDLRISKCSDRYENRIGQNNPKCDVDR